MFDVVKDLAQEAERSFSRSQEDTVVCPVCKISDLRIFQSFGDGGFGEAQCRCGLILSLQAIMKSPLLSNFGFFGAVSVAVSPSAKLRSLFASAFEFHSHRNCRSQPKFSFTKSSGSNCCSLSLECASCRLHQLVL